MDGTAIRPWLAQYDPGKPTAIVPDYTDALRMFQDAVARAPDRPAILYFDGSLTYRELDTESTRLATLLRQRGFAPGDRFAIYLQNVPAFVIALLAAWKAGGIAVAINPMNRSRELAILFRDCTPTALILHPALFGEYVNLPEDVPHPSIVLTASPFDYQTRNDPRLFANIATEQRDDDLRAALRAVPADAPAAPRFGKDDIAFLVYTSGTTGVPKGALNTHGNATFNAQVYRDWIELEEGKPVLGIAPLFHITGLIGHIAAAFITAAPLVLSYRFEPGVMLDSVEEHRPAFTIGAITAFIAMMNAPTARREQLASLTKIYSGGAPIPPSVVSAFRDAFGHTIRNGYGLTETSSPAVVVPLRAENRIDPHSGTLAIGVPAFNADLWVVGEDGQPLGPGEVGEIVISGPMVVPGYWNKPEQTAEAMRPDGFRTGDVGFMDADGWFYLVDRKKDMINSSGYKVWPREVEDVLYSHPAVREAAVVAAQDAYRGETVRAVISLKPGMEAEPEEIITFCKERMAAYKYPRIVDIIDELPKTPTGKILRRELRV